MAQQKLKEKQDLVNVFHNNSKLKHLIDPKNIFNIIIFIEIRINLT